MRPSRASGDQTSPNLPCEPPDEQGMMRNAERCDHETVRRNQKRVQNGGSQSSVGDVCASRRVGPWPQRAGSCFRIDNSGSRLPSPGPELPLLRHRRRAEQRDREQVDDGSAMRVQLGLPVCMWTDTTSCTTCALRTRKFFGMTLDMTFGSRTSRVPSSKVISRPVFAALSRLSDARPSDTTQTTFPFPHLDTTYTLPQSVVETPTTTFHEPQQGFGHLANHTSLTGYEPNALNHTTLATLHNHHDPTRQPIQCLSLSKRRHTHW